MMDKNNGGVRKYGVDSGRVCRRMDILRDRRVGFVAITPTIKLFSAGSGELFFADIGHDEE